MNAKSRETFVSVLQNNSRKYRDGKSFVEWLKKKQRKNTPVISERFMPHWVERHVLKVLRVSRMLHRFSNERYHYVCPAWWSKWCRAFLLFSTNSWNGNTYFNRGNKEQRRAIGDSDYHQSTAHKVGSADTIVLFAILAETKEYRVYDHLRRKKTNYPFIFMITEKKSD